MYRVGKYNMIKLSPRDYQEHSINAGMNFLKQRTDNRRGLLLEPTGTGKSVEIAESVNRTIALYAPARILMMTHSKELVEQNYEKARNMCDVPVGLWHAGLRRKQYASQIVFAGIDTVANNPHLLGRRDVCFIDEAHRVAPSPETSYQLVLSYLEKLNPNMKSLGWTATDYRLGQGLLTDAWYDRKTQTLHEPFWQEVLSDNTSLEKFNWFFDQGYLKKLVAKAPHNEIDVTKLRISAATQDYNKADLERELNNEEKIKAIVDEICDNGFDRKSWLVFAAGNKNAHLIGAEIEKRGATVGVITEKTSATERAHLLAEYKAYRIRCLVNNDILTTGFDHAGVDLIAVVRVTTSTALWVQMLGRGTRPVYLSGFDLNAQNGRLAAIFASGVYNCLVLDFAGNSKRLGAINDPVKPKAPHNKSKQAQGDAALKMCGNDDCRTYVYASQKVCPECGYDFPFSALLETTAGTAELVVEETHIPDIRRLAVTSVKFDTKVFHAGRTEVSRLTVVYNCGKNGKFTENLTFGAAMTKRTKLWWQAFGDGGELPYNNDDFIKYCSGTRIKRVATIDVYMNKQKCARPEIIEYAFTDSTTFNFGD